MAWFLRWLLHLLEEEDRRKRARTIVLVQPIVTRKGIPVNFPLPQGQTSYILIQYLDKNGNPTQAPSGDTLSVASSDPNLTVAIGAMPSGQFSGQPCVVATPVGVSTGITVTVTDTANLTPGVQIYDITPTPPGPAVSLLQNTNEVISIPITGQAKVAGTTTPAAASTTHPVVFG